eukprot:274062-Amphidinium_carterae.2
MESSYSCTDHKGNHSRSYKWKNRNLDIKLGVFTTYSGLSKRTYDKGNPVVDLILLHFKETHLEWSMIMTQLMLLQACARLHNGTLTKNDAFWEIDVFVLKQLVACGSELLKSKWQSGFKQGVNLEDAIAFANKLVAGDAFKWSAQAIQSELKTCQGFLQRLKDHEAVADDSQMTTFVTEFLKLLEERFLVEPYIIKNSTSSSSSTNTPTAAEILAKILADHASKSEGKSLETLVPLSVWRHLLSDEQRSQVVSIRNMLLKTAKEQAPEPAKKPAPKAKGKAKQPANTEAAMDAAALALFR